MGFTINLKHYSETQDSGSLEPGGRRPTRTSKTILNENIIQFFTNPTLNGALVMAVKKDYGQEYKGIL